MPRSPSLLPRHRSVVRSLAVALAWLLPALALTGCGEDPTPPSKPTSAERRATLQALEASLPELHGCELRDALMELSCHASSREPDRAVRLGERALEALVTAPDPEVEHRLQLTLSRAHTNRGQLEDAERCLQRAIDLVHEIEAHDGPWRTQRAIAYLRVAQRRFPEALEATAETRRLANDSGDLQRIVHSGMLHGRTLLDAGEAFDGLEALLDTWILAEEALARGEIEPELEAELSNNLGAAYDFNGCPELAVEHYRRTLEIWKGHKRLEVVARQNIAASLRRMGRPREALEMNVAALQIANRCSDRMSVGQLHHNTAGALLDLGRVEDALSHARTCLEIFSELDSPGLRMRAEAILGHVQLMRDQLDDAERLLESAFDEAHETGERELLLGILPLLADLETRRGHHENANDARELLAMFTSNADASNGREQLLALHTRFESLKREREVAHLAGQIAAERTSRDSAWLLLAVLVGVVSVAGFATRIRIRTLRQVARAEQELATTQSALAAQTQLAESRQSELKVLQGLLPICCYCKKIRDDDGRWAQLERYIDDHSEATFTHSYCPDCVSQAEAEME